MTKHNYCFVFVSSGFDEKHRNIITRGVPQFGKICGIDTATEFKDFIIRLNQMNILWKKS